MLVLIMIDSKAVKIAISDEDVSKCFDTVAELRPHLKKDSFVSMVRGMEEQGYRLAYIEEGGMVVAAAGYRIFTNLFMGKNLYVDDLVTGATSRSRGHGKALLDYLRKLAIAENCAYLHLDSGTQRHRAHRFYLREGLNIASFHFSEKLDTL